MTPSFLERIVARKAEEVARARAALPEAALLALVRDAPAPRRFEACLSPRGGPVRVIAEVKRASPSAGPIDPGLDAPAQARRYAAAGAAAISVLTDGPGFGGSLDDLRAVRAAVDVPLLRKDFVVDRYQLLEARAAGADAALLIVAALPPAALRRLILDCAELSLAALVEVHDEAEVGVALTAGARVVGVNNRNLHTFQVDLATSERILPLLPAAVKGVAESGVRTPADAARLRRAGAANLLVGEALVRAPDPGALLAALTASAPARGERPAGAPVLVKICGITRAEDARLAVRLGADALGFNFWPGSRRYLAPEVAAPIVAALPPGVLPVGVFVDAPRDALLRAVEVSGVRQVQLHGSESPTACAGLPVPVVKAIRVGDARALAQLASYEVAAFLLDSATPGYGGSGVGFDWSLAEEVARALPIWLAGGLTPENVGEAVRRVHPRGVDVASGVESAPGVKDPAKLEAFIRTAKEAGEAGFGLQATGYGNGEPSSSRWRGA